MTTKYYQKKKERKSGSKSILFAVNHGWGGKKEKSGSGPALETNK